MTTSSDTPRDVRNGVGSRLGVLILLLGCIALGWITLHQWLNLRQNTRVLNASLLARSTADYSRNQPGTQVSQVGLGIIGDMLRDSQLDSEVLSHRLATVTAVLLSPVPTSTPGSSFTNPPAPGPAATPTPTPAATRLPPSTATKSGLPTAGKASATPISTNTPTPVSTASNVPATPNPSSAPVPTPTPGTTATRTPAPNPSPSAPVPTPTPATTATTTPAPDPSLDPTSTPKYTKTPKPTHTPKPTNTHRPDKTQKPTKTPKH